MTITKAEIIDHIQSKLGLSRLVVENILTQIFGEIEEILTSSSRIQIPGFGSFEVRQKNARPGVNMKTKEKMIISPRKVVSFVPSRILKDRINGKLK